LLTVVGIVVVALLFDYTNGFHDSANSISTVVATRVLRPGGSGPLEANQRCLAPERSVGAGRLLRGEQRVPEIALVLG
jgi:hypothetical protein